MEIIFINNVHMQMEMRKHTSRQYLGIIRCFHVKKRDTREFGDSVTRV